MARNPIIAFVGDLGSGKTLCQSIFLYKICIVAEQFKSSIQIFTNYNLDFKMKYPDIEFMSPRFIRDFFKSNKFNIKDAFVVLDEISTFADSYKWFNKEINNFAKFALQSRKRHIQIYYTTQFMSLVPPRIRKVTNMLIRPCYNELLDLLTYDVYRYDGTREYYLYTKHIKETSKYFGIYDTDEVVEIIDLEE